MECQPDRPHHHMTVHSCDFQGFAQAERRSAQMNSPLGYLAHVSHFLQQPGDFGRWGRDRFCGGRLCGGRMRGNAGNRADDQFL